MDIDFYDGLMSIASDSNGVRFHTKKQIWIVWLVEIGGKLCII